MRVLWMSQASSHFLPTVVLHNTGGQIWLLPAETNTAGSGRAFSAAFWRWTTSQSAAWRSAMEKMDLGKRRGEAGASAVNISQVAFKRYLPGGRLSIIFHFFFGLSMEVWSLSQWCVSLSLVCIQGWWVGGVDENAALHDWKLGAVLQHLCFSLSRPLNCSTGAVGGCSRTFRQQPPPEWLNSRGPPAVLEILLEDVT